MSGITLEVAQARLDALLTSSASGRLSTRFADRQTVYYNSRKEMLDEITYWSRIVAQLQRTAAGQSQHGFVLADLRGCR